MTDFKERIRSALLLREGRAGAFTEVTLISLNFIFVLLYLLSTYSLSSPYREIVLYSEFFLAILFTMELSARIYAAQDRRGEIINFYTLIDVLSIAPVYLFFLVPGGIFQAGFLRAFRILRAFRFLRFLEDREFWFGSISRDQLELLKLVTSVSTIFFVSAGFFYEFEHALNSGVNTMVDSLYYTVVTLTTVGFGDITPATQAGRWVTIASITAAIIVLPYQAGKIVKNWTHREKERKPCPECGLEYHDPDASHCKACGAVIYQEHDSRTAEYL